MRQTPGAFVYPSDSSPLPVVKLEADGPAAEGAGAELLSELLRRWETILLDHRFPLEASTNPALDRNDVSMRVSEAGLGPSPELESWLGWRNGQPHDSPRLTPSFAVFADLDSALAIREFQRPNFGHGYGNWEPSWLSLCFDRASLAVDTAIDVEPRVRMVDFVEFGTWGESAHTQVRSLCTAVTWFIEALESGGHAWDVDTEEWVRDLELLDPIAATLGYV